MKLSPKKVEMLALISILLACKGRHHRPLTLVIRVHVARPLAKQPRQILRPHWKSVGRDDLPRLFREGARYMHTNNQCQGPVDDTPQTKHEISRGVINPVENEVINMMNCAFRSVVVYVLVFAGNPTELQLNTILVKHIYSPDVNIYPLIWKYQLTQCTQFRAYLFVW